MYKVLSAESYSGGDPQPAAAAVAANQNPPLKKPPSKNPLLFSESFLSSGKQNKVEQQFSRRGVTL
jgi:hypothetical protein